MAYVNPSTQSIKTCFQSHYSLPYFQREYKWETRHFAELLNDIQNTFILCFDPTHGRQEVANYLPYFLGSIITSKESDGKKPLIDGQQRLTSTFLILAYLERYRKDNDIKDAADLSTLLGNLSYGKMDYSIEFSESRKLIFNAYLDNSKALVDAMQDAEDVADIDDGDKKIIEALRTTDSLLDDTVRDGIAYFIDYVKERVLLIDISVESESEAHRVFVTMNDRGLRLGPIDLLKGLILSEIKVAADSHSCHEAWVEVIRKLRTIDPEEDSLFFRNLFRAQWANTMRGKTKGDPAGDFDIIGDSYHRWFEDNTQALGLNNADDYARFAKDDITKFSEIYIFIKNAESELKAGHECIYYNASRRFSFQAMILMAAISINDTTTQWQNKIRIASQFIDLVLTSRTIDGKANNYDNLKEISFNLAKDFRKKDYPQLLQYIQTEWPKYFSSIPRLDQFRYTKTDRSDILYILARIACHLEDAFSLTNKVGFTTFWQRDRGYKTFDIEHLLKDSFDTTALPTNHGFTDAKDYADSRNLLGALILLSRSRNRSLQDDPYTKKLHAYSSENILSQSLCDGFYQSNPTVTTYLKANPQICLVSITDFEKADIGKRAAVYIAVAQQIWKMP